MVAYTNFFVRYNEVDSMGIVHHANYILWFESGRRVLLKKIGVPVSKINSSGFFLPLTKIKCQYKSPAKYNDSIEVITRIIKMSCVMIEFEYKILNKMNGKVLALGNTVHAWTDGNIQPVNIQREAPEIYALLKSITENKEGQITE